jgi:hypothetical protein
MRRSGRGSLEWKGVVDSDDFSRRLAHDSTTVNVDLLNFRVRDENG